MIGGAISDAGWSAIILGGALLLFISGKVRHDPVTLITLFNCMAVGLATSAKAFLGFADPAVLAVAAILVGAPAEG